MNGDGYVTADLLISVAPPTPSAPAWTDEVLAAATTGLPYVDAVAASGYPDATYTLDSGALPPGLTLDAVTGAITGTPTLAGDYVFTVAASNTEGTVTSTLTLSVTDPLPVAPVWTDEVLAAATTGLPYVDAVAASGVPPASYEVTAGALPTGLSLDPATGAISGIPLAAGDFSFTVAASNTEGTVTSALSISVTDPLLPGGPCDGLSFPCIESTTVNGGAAPAGMAASVLSAIPGVLSVLVGPAGDLASGDLTGLVSDGDTIVVEVNLGTEDPSSYFASGRGRILDYAERVSGTGDRIVTVTLQATPVENSPVCDGGCPEPTTATGVILSAAFTLVAANDVLGPSQMAGGFVSFDASGLSLLPAGDSFAFEVTGPHFLPDGTTLNVGSVHLFLPTGVLTGILGIADPESAVTQMEVAQNGGEFPGGVTVTPDVDGVFVTLDGLTFSTHQFSLFKAQPQVDPTPGPADSPTSSDSAADPASSNDADTGGNAGDDMPTAPPVPPTSGPDGPGGVVKAPPAAPAAPVRPDAPASRSPMAAPQIVVGVGGTYQVVVREGLVNGRARVAVQQADGTWTTLGKVTVRNGRATMPNMAAMAPGEYLVKITTKGKKPRYVKLVVR